MRSYSASCLEVRSELPEFSEPEHRVAACRRAAQALGGVAWSPIRSQRTGWPGLARAAFDKLQDFLDNGHDDYLFSTMSTSIQPITTTELQGNPTELLKRIEKEGAIPVLVDAKPTLALIRARELKRLRNENARLKRELFARELLAGEEEYKSKGGIGPFSSAKEFMAHLDSSSKMSTDER